MSLSIRPDDTRLTWAGAVSFDYSDGAVMPWRIPFEERDLFGGPLQVRSAFPAGVRIAFRSDTSVVAGRVKPSEQPAILDLCVDGEFHSSVDLTEGDDDDDGDDAGDAGDEPMNDGHTANAAASSHGAGTPWKCLQCTFENETDVNLFGEQVLLSAAAIGVGSLPCLDRSFHDFQ